MTRYPTRFLHPHSAAAAAAPLPLTHTHTPAETTGKGRTKNKQRGRGISKGSDQWRGRQGTAAGEGLGAAAVSVFPNGAAAHEPEKLVPAEPPPPPQGFCCRHLCHRGRSRREREKEIGQEQGTEGGGAQQGRPLPPVTVACLCCVTTAPCLAAVDLSIVHCRRSSCHRRLSTTKNSAA
ncbi:uncharacterized protein DS421_7g219230 [Arachis hypogaea]|nr:uncharacterized protein DS421_7g219220 [Arachis hypogaea]QHO28734.1 uncharacterized protein DS421_7g219230 [Arachis hypogaea]